MKIKLKIVDGNIEITFDSKEEFYAFVEEWSEFKSVIRKMDES